MTDAASVVLKATQARNVQGILDGGEALNSSCDACHQKYQISVPVELPTQSR
jgi:cytochrome c556